MHLQLPPSAVRCVAARITSAVMLILVAAACSPSPDTAEPPVDRPRSASEGRSQTGPTESPVVTFPDGFEVKLELAITPDELAQGLMFRPSLAEDRGMLLIFGEERLPNIWMMNTLVALDLVYLDRTGTVVDVIAGAQPCPSEPCPRFTPKRPAQAVLEIPAGSAGRHAVTEGTLLVFSAVPDFPVAD
jgi:uncharacterized membrane protein (UPF0127 family)